MNKVTVNVLLENPSSQPGLLLRSPGLSQLLFVLTEGNHPVLPHPSGSPLHNSLLSLSALCCTERPCSSPAAPLQPRSACRAQDAGPGSPGKPFHSSSGIQALTEGQCCQVHSHHQLTRFSPELGHKEAVPATPRQLQPILAGFVQLFLHCCTCCLCHSLCSRGGMKCMTQKSSGGEVSHCTLL